MRRILAVLLVLSASAPAAQTGRAAQERAKAEIKMRPAVAQAAGANCPGAVIDRMDVEKEAGIALYDIEFRNGQGLFELQIQVGGKTKSVTIDAGGKTIQ